MSKGNGAMTETQVNVIRAIVAKCGNPPRPVAYEVIRGTHDDRSREDAELRQAIHDLQEAGLVAYSGPDFRPEMVALTRQGEKVAAELPSAPPDDATRDVDAGEDFERQMDEEFRREQQRQAEEARLDEDAAKWQRRITELEQANERDLR